MIHLLATIVVTTVWVQRASAQAGCCSAWWIVPDGSILTRLQSTMIIPKLSTGKGLHYVWPGMEPRNGNFVFQNVIGDQQPAGEWSFATWYGPYDTAGDYHEYGTVIVEEGDSLTTDFVLNTSTNEWVDNWILEPTVNGSKAGNGGVSAGFPKQGALTDSIFEIELQQGATWDFGPVTWTDIIMEANTTSTEWCTSMTTPVVGMIGSTTQCYIAKLTFESP